MKKYLPFISLFIISLYLITGCSPSQYSHNHDSNVYCSIMLGSGGGFTGTYEGIYIDSAGSVYKWTGRTFDSSEKSLLKKLNKDEIYSIINLIDTSGVQNTSYSEHGNISSFITLKTNKGENRISWNGLEPDSKVPENIRNFYSAIKQITN